jgi:hypothetical protein
MSPQHLQIMYQQWQQDNENYVLDWIAFVEIAAREYQTTQDEVIHQLQKCYWFHWPKE